MSLSKKKISIFLRENERKYDFVNYFYLNLNKKVNLDYKLQFILNFTNLKNKIFFLKNDLYLFKFDKKDFIFFINLFLNNNSEIIKFFGVNFNNLFLNCRNINELRFYFNLFLNIKNFFYLKILEILLYTLFYINFILYKVIFFIRLKC
jgi:hypothetical protein